MGFRGSEVQILSSRPVFPLIPISYPSKRKHLGPLISPGCRRGRSYPRIRHPQGERDGELGPFTSVLEAAMVPPAWDPIRDGPRRTSPIAPSFMFRIFIVVFSLISVRSFAPRLCSGLRMTRFARQFPVFHPVHKVHPSEQDRED